MAVIEINNENFEKEVMKSDLPVLLDFWASWCGPCKMMLPVVDDIAESMTSIKVGKVNVDECQDLAARYNVKSIPTFIAFKNGAEVGRTVGVQSKEELMKLMAK